MRLAITFLIVFVNLILQSTVFEYIQIAGIKPNIAILIVITYAMLRGDIEGAILGFFSGLLQDIFSGRVIGIHALLGTLTGYFCGKPFKDFYKENYMLPLLLTLLGSLFYEFIFYFTSFLFLGKTEMFYYLRKIMIPTTIYTTALSLPAYRLLYVINNKLEEKESVSRKLF